MDLFIHVALYDPRFYIFTIFAVVVGFAGGMLSSKWLRKLDEEIK